MNWSCLAIFWFWKNTLKDKLRSNHFLAFTFFPFLMILLLLSIHSISFKQTNQVIVYILNLILVLMNALFLRFCFSMITMSESLWWSLLMMKVRKSMTIIKDNRTLFFYHQFNSLQGNPETWLGVRCLLYMPAKRKWCDMKVIRIKIWISYSNRFLTYACSCIK